MKRYLVLYSKNKSLEDKNKALTFLNSITEKANFVEEKKWWWAYYNTNEN